MAKEVSICAIVDVGDFSQDSMEVETVDKSWDEALAYAKKKYKKIVKSDKKTNTIYIKESRKVIEAFVAESANLEIVNKKNIADIETTIKAIYKSLDELKKNLGDIDQDDTYTIGDVKRQMSEIKEYLEDITDK